MSSRERKKDEKGKKDKIVLLGKGIMIETRTITSYSSEALKNLTQNVRTKIEEIFKRKMR